MNTNGSSHVASDWAATNSWLVTGGAGFIGSHLTEALLARGQKVVVVDDFSTGRRENLPEHPALMVLAKDLLDLTAADLPGPIAGITHLAALPSVTESWSKPLHAHRLNLTATLRMLELARECAIPRFVLASSAAVYGAQDHLPIGEEAPALPQSPYGAQKAMSEGYLSLYARETGLSGFALRFFNVYGPRQRPDSPYSGVISIFTKRMRDGMQLIVYGDGHQTRDFIYVADVARAVACALAAPPPPERFAALNIGTGKSQSVRTLIEALTPLFPGWPGEMVFTPARPGEILHSQADCRRAWKLCNFQAEWNLDAGLAALVRS